LEQTNRIMESGIALLFDCSRADSQQPFCALAYTVSTAAFAEYCKVIDHDTQQWQESRLYHPVGFV
jgi:hypothetical protein